MLGTSGTLSVLIEEKPFQFLITVSGKDKGELQEDDFVMVDEFGQTRGSASIKPSAETLLHGAIYRHTGAKAVFHVHTTNSTLLSMRNAECEMRNGIAFEGLEMLKGLGFKTHGVKATIPVIENSQDMKYLATIAPSCINEEVPGLLLKGHGIYAWGNSLQETKRHVEIFEFLFEYRVKELSLK